MTQFARFASVCLLMIAFGIFTHAQESEVIKQISLESYDEILNILFPRQVAAEVEGKWGSVLITVLRYEPSFDAESQIVITVHGGSAYLTEYKSLDDNIFYKANDIFSKTGEDNPKELAKQIRVGKRYMKLPVQTALRWRRNLLKSISVAVASKRTEISETPKQIDMVFDGTRHRFWDESFDGKLYFEPVGGGITGRAYPGKEQFVRWMDAIQREVGKRK